MYFFPYAIPDSVPLVWAGGTVNVALAMSAIGAALFLAILALRAQRGRGKETVPRLRVASAGRTQAPLPRAAA